MSLVRPAAQADIPELVRLRELMFAEIAQGSAADDAWRERCAAALAQQIDGGTMRILVVDGDTGLAACGVGVVDQRLPSPYHPGEGVGHVFGVVTDPAYRGRGSAHAIMEALLAWFRVSGVRRVDLNASAAGIPLYRGLGFAERPSPVLSWTP